jgi:hypothetical protein
MSTPPGITTIPEALIVFVLLPCVFSTISLGYCSVEGARVEILIGRFFQIGSIDNYIILAYCKLYKLNEFLKFCGI